MRNLLVYFWWSFANSLRPVLGYAVRMLALSDAVGRERGGWLLATLTMSVVIWWWFGGEFGGGGGAGRGLVEVVVSSGLWLCLGRWRDSPVCLFFVVFVMLVFLWLVLMTSFAVLVAWKVKKVLPFPLSLSISVNRYWYTKYWYTNIQILALKRFISRSYLWSSSKIR